MFRILSVCLILIIADLGIAQEKKDVIEWSNERLTWNDFQGTPLTSSNFIAVSAGKISVSPITSEVTLSNEVHLTVRALFYKKKSWSITNSKEILKHEQLHADIRELYARLIRKKLLEKAVYGSREDAQKRIDLVYSELDKKMRKTQGEYDDETDHSMNKKSQQEWDEKIAIQLEGLKEYTDTELTITIK